jgi:Domain of unknown function (DUF397)
MTNEHDLSRAQWRKSSYSGNTGNCVEVANLGDDVAIRDSKDPHGPMLVVQREAWRAFMRDCHRSTRDGQLAKIMPSSSCR